MPDPDTPKVPPMRLLPLIAMLVILATAVPAATLETEITPEMAEMGCTARLSGQILAGDLERIRPYLETDLGLSGRLYPGAEEDIAWRNFSPALTWGFPGMFVHRLCLDSPGGSLTEALRIADVIRATPFGDGSIGGGIPTAIARGDTCDGACALLFFAGRFVLFEGDANYETGPDFILHPMGGLGLHAPSPGPDAATGSSGHSRDTWRAAMATVAQIAHGITNGTVRMPHDLFGQMLAHSSDRKLSIETVGQAVRWNIDLAPNALYFGFYPRSPDDLFDALCRNAPSRAPVYLDLQFDGTRVTRAGSRDGTAMSDPLFTDLRTGTRYACHVEEWALALPEQRWHHVPQTAPLQSGRTAVFSAPDLPLCAFRVGFVGSCTTQCEFEVELPCFAAYPPETRLPEIDAGLPRPR